MASGERRFIFLSGGYPPQLDGIGDHTRRLACEMARSVPVEVWTTRLAGAAPDDGFPVREVFDRARPSSILNLPNGVDVHGATVFLQYNPFGFGPRGLNPWLIRALRGRKLSVMFHETMVPAEGWKFRLMRLYQKAQFRALVRMSRRIFVSTGRWAAEVRTMRGDAQPILLPVGSNVDRSTKTKHEARSMLGIPENLRVAVVFGSAHPSRLFDWVAAGWRRIRACHPGAVLLSIGADGSRLAEEVGSGFRDCGTVSAERVGDFLIAGDVMLAPFIDGLSTRRGSVSAALQHGLPVVSTKREWTDTLLQNCPGLRMTSVDAGPEAFAAACEASLKETVSAGGIENFYRTHFDWPVVARTVLASHE